MKRIYVKIEYTTDKSLSGSLEVNLENPDEFDKLKELLRLADNDFSLQNKEDKITKEIK